MGAITELSPFQFAGLMRRQPRATPRASAAASAATPGGDSSSAGKQFSEAFYRTRLLTFAAMFIGYGMLLDCNRRCKCIRSKPAHQHQT